MDDKTRALIEEAQKGNKEALEELTVKNVKMIQGIANRYKRTKHDPEDLFQLACVGFVRAVQKFDLSTDYQLSTYAYRLIHNEIYKFLRVEGTIKPPRAFQEVERLIKKHECYEKTPEEIAEIIGITDIKLIKETLMYIHNGQVLSLNKVAFEGNDGTDITLEEMIVGDDSSNFWDDNIAIKEAIEQLDERERYVIEQRYDKDRSQRELAEEVGVSQAHISRIEIGALKKVREFLGIPEPPKVKKVKKIKPDAKTTGRKPKGDREKAIHLLKTSSLSYQDISDITGVPHGSIYKIGREHRPQFIKDIIKNRPTQQKGELNVYEA